MYRYVIPWLPQNPSPRKEGAYYLVAALFAYHPKYTLHGNMGAHLAQTRGPEGGDEALERRFTALLAAHPEDLPVYLRQAVSYLKSKDEIPVNWSQLLRDLQSWAHPDRFVQKRWAGEFWRRSNPPAK
jgi:CRISPR type I-E-associated protein CasB/Cse2